MGGLALVGQTWKATAAHLLVRQMGIRIEGNPEPYLIRIHVADGGVGGKKRKEVYFLIINDGTVPLYGRVPSMRTGGKIYLWDLGGMMTSSGREKRQTT